MNQEHILIVHGYLLQDSGSCTYVRNLAKGFHKQGYRVTISCQDFNAHELKGFGKVMNDIDEDHSDQIDVFLPIKPHEHNLLPVYIYNPYEGYNAKTIINMTIEEGEKHIEIVSNRLAGYIAHHKVDFIFTNHCLFSPVIVRRALQSLDLDKPIKYVSKIHGSALNFIVAKDPRWMPYVLEGLGNASKLICGTKYMKDRIGKVFDSNANKLPHISTVSCGVDTSLFSGHIRDTKLDIIKIVYFSNILNTKGIAEVVTAMPHIKKLYPNIEFHIIGDGTYRKQLETMLKSQEEGDLEKYKSAAEQDDFIESSVDIDKYFAMVNEPFIHYHGFMTHDYLAPFLASCHINIVPSKSPEAFGMVTIEAMSAGVLPIVMDHSGLSNVVDLVSAFDPVIANHMRIPFEDKVSIDHIIQTASNAIEYIHKEIDLDVKLHNIALSFDWSKICDNIIHI